MNTQEMAEETPKIRDGADSLDLDSLDLYSLDLESKFLIINSLLEISVSLVKLALGHLDLVATHL
jgi:hypothetical protein